MKTPRDPSRPGRTPRDPELVRSCQIPTTFTPGERRRLQIYAAQQDRTPAYLIHQAITNALDAAGITDDGIRDPRTTKATR